ncbi:MAG: acyl-ACP--UDP-N-acetylglucosamine O-acyltransferase [Rikenellaceae bacterium]|jgi:UDP-N-acetylglucosamine acyltransferase|nr:acyl-ACP--UDP-N-acetylglucosamine O-acyltransferase [Rikenellaceae bacterium]MBO5759301.1 acyl-ACP--UDP-N-acetylglucosamine O-acyltransferase [Rikenellaceae bacterium]
MISNLAYVHPDATIGQNVTIEPFAYVGADVIIGDDCYIGPNSQILPGTRMGKGCKVFGAILGGEPQDLKFKGEYTTLEIGDYNTFREACTVNRGTAAKGRTVIGSHNLFMACSHIGHDVVVGSHCVIVNAVLVAGEVVIGDWAILGGNSAVHQFVRIGEHAMISGGSLVSKDVPPFVKAARNPLSFVGANYIGLRRRGFSSEKISEIQEIFRILFQSGYAYGRACDIVEDNIARSPERDLIVGFFRASKRGVIKPYNVALGDTED